MKTPALIAMLLASAVIALPSSGAVAQDKKEGVTEPETEAPNPAPSTPSIQSSLGKYGDPGGLRAFLEKKGITYQFTYIGEVLGNTSGGVKRGATYEGVIYATADIDTEKFAGIKGGQIHASGYNIHGRGLTGNNLLDLFTVSSIEAYPDTLLFEASYEQKLLNDKVAVRFGQLAADTEFYISQVSTLFVNATFGWPGDVSNNLPSGGPAYPLGTPGVRVRVNPIDNLTILTAVFNGDPAGPFIPGVNSPIIQARDPGGVNFRLQDPPLFITEGQYAYNQGKDAKGLPGTVKLGYLHHFGKFASFDAPNVDLRGNDTVYAVLDQSIYRKPGTEDQGASIFVRASLAPQDRNLIDYYVDAGISYKGLIPGRGDDTVGIAGAYGHISPSVTRSDILAGAAPLIRDYQALIEATYQYVVLPGFSLQPDFQYIFHPGANGVADPSDGRPARNAAVFGLRTTIVY